MNASERKGYIRRRRGACDGCKQRKVRCDGETPCAPCYRSNSACRYQQPSRRQPSVSVPPSLRTSIETELSPPAHLLSPVFSPASQISHWSVQDDKCLSSPWLTTFNESISLFQAPSDPRFSFQNVNGPQNLSNSHQLQPSTGFHLPKDCQDYFPENFEFYDDQSLITPSPELIHDQLIHVSEDDTFQDNVSAHSKKVDFSPKSVFSDLRFTSLAQKAHNDVSSVIHYVKSQDWALERPREEIFEVSYDGQAMSYIEACYNDSFGVSLFLRREFLDWVGGQVITRKTNHAPSIMLTHAVLAIGCYISKVQRGGDTKYGLAEAHAWFDVAEQRRNSLDMSEYSKEAFMAVVTMLLFARKCSKSLECSLLATTSNMAVALGLNSTKSIQNLCDDENSRLELQRAYWVYYFFEKTHSLRLGRYSMIEDSILDHKPPSRLRTSKAQCGGSQDVEFDVLIHQCRFAKICHLISKRLYEPSGMQKSTPELSRTLLELQGLLAHWKNVIPFPHRPLDLEGTSELTQELCRATQESLQLSYQYYEALFAIQGRWRLSDPSQFTAEDMGMVANSREICANVARIALQTSSEFRLSTLLSDWAIAQLPLHAAMILFLDIMDLKNSCTKDNTLPYLSIAEGFYSRLSSLDDGPYNAVLSITKTVRRL